MAATYMLRPNPATLAWLHEHRHAADIKLNEPKTLRVAAYVRRADKGIEMELVDVHRLETTISIAFYSSLVRLIIDTSSCMGASKVSRSRGNIIRHSES